MMGGKGAAVSGQAGLWTVRNCGGPAWGEAEPPVSSPGLVFQYPCVV